MKVALEKQLNVHYLAELMGSRWAHYIRHAPPEQIRPLALGKVGLCPSMITWLNLVDSFTRRWLMCTLAQGALLGLVELKPGCSIDSARRSASIDPLIAEAWGQLPLGH